MLCVNYWTKIKRFFKEAAPTLQQQRLIALILLLCQGGITVSGSIVRVTGSGIGLSHLAGMPTRLPCPYGRRRACSPPGHRVW